MENKRGITLIALVITIIVLLILAGVSISAITGENGIVDKAKEASEKTEEAEKEEQKILKGYEDLLNSATENLNPSEPDATFPYGTIYVDSNNSSTGMAIYENGVAEVILIDVNRMMLIEYTGTGQCVIEGTTLTIGDGAAVYTIAEDYSTISNDNFTLNKSNTILEYCEHKWESISDEDAHQCAECPIYQYHELESVDESTHKCEVCEYSASHTYESSNTCDSCGYGCIHSNTTSSTTDNTDGTHTVTETCTACSTTVSQETVSHTDTDSNGTCDGCTATIDSTTNIITFTIEGVEYQAEEGMTWGEWVFSSYNTIGYVSSNGVPESGTIDDSTHEHWIVETYNGGTPVYADEIINEGQVYYIRDYGGGGAFPL